MKNILIKFFTALLGLGLAGYAIWLITTWATVVADPTYNMIALSIVALLGLYIVMLGFFAAVVPTGRIGLAVFGVIVMMAAHLYLIDAPEQYIYLSDITKLASVVLIVWWLSKLWVTQAIQKAKDDKDIEVIEV